MINRVFERIAGLKVYIPLSDQGYVGKKLVADAAFLQQALQRQAKVHVDLMGGPSVPEFKYTSLRAHEASADQTFVAGKDSVIGDISFAVHHKPASLLTPSGRYMHFRADGSYAGWRHAA